MATVVGSIETKFTGDSSGLKKAVVEATAQYDKLSARSKILQTALATAAATAEVQSDELAILKTEASKAARGLEALSSATMEQVQVGERFAGGLQTQQSAVREVTDSIDRLTSRAAILRDALENTKLTAGLSATQMRALRKATEEAEQAAKRHTAQTQKQTTAQRQAGAAVGNFSKQVGGAKANLGQAAQSVSALTGKMDGLGSSANSALGLVASGVAGFAVGGAIGAALTVGSELLSKVIDNFGEMGSAAKRAAEDASRGMQDLNDEIASVANELEALDKGISAPLLTLQKAEDDAIAAAEKLGNDAIAGLGENFLLLEARVDSFRDAMASGIQTFVEIQGVGKVAIEDVVSAFDDLDAAQDKALKKGELVRLKTELIAKQEAAKDKDKDKDKPATADEIFAALDEATDTLRQSLDDSDDAFQNLVAIMTPLGKITLPELNQIFSDLAGEGAELEIVEDILGDSLQMLSAGLLRSGRSARDFAAEADGAVQELQRAAQRAADFFTDAGGVASAVAGGTIGAEGGAALGAVAGTAVGAVVTGGADGGAIGGAIGSVIGSIFGSALDELISALGVLAPLFDGVGDVIAAFQPAFAILRESFTAWGSLLSDGLAPVILALMRPLAAMFVPLVRLLQITIVVVIFFLQLVAVLIQMFDIFTVFVDFMDRAVMLPLLNAVVDVVNGFIQGLDTLVDGIGAFISGLGALLAQMPGFEDIGKALQEAGENFGIDIPELERFDSIIGKFSDGFEDFENGINDSTDAMDENAKTMREFGRELTNVPKGFKVPSNVFASADPGNPSQTRGPFSGLDQGGGALIVNIDKFMSSGGFESDFTRIKQTAAAGVVFQTGSQRGSNGSERN